MLPPPNHTWPTEWQRMGLCARESLRTVLQMVLRKTWVHVCTIFQPPHPSSGGNLPPLVHAHPSSCNLPFCLQGGCEFSLTWFHFNKLLRETNAIGAFHTPHTGRAGTALIFTSPRPLLLASLHISPPGFQGIWILHHLRAVGAQYKASGTNPKLKTLQLLLV